MVKLFKKAESQGAKYSGNIYIQFERGDLGRNHNASELTKFDSNVRKFNNEDFGDTAAKIIWVK